MKKIETLTQDALEPLIQKGTTVLLFSATWCADCHFLEPFLPEIEADFPDIAF